MSMVGLYTFTKTAFILIADGLKTTNSRRTSNAASTSTSFPLQTWVTRAPITSYAEKSQQDCVRLKYSTVIFFQMMTNLFWFVPEAISISTWLKSQPTSFYHLLLQTGFTNIIFRRFRIMSLTTLPSSLDLVPIFYQ